MTKLLIRILVIASSLFLAEYLVEGIAIGNWYNALIAATVLGLLNIFVRPLLFILTLPITILTLGLFTFVINALLFWFAASFIEGFVVDSFVSALLGSLIVSLVSTLATKHLIK